MILRPTNFLPFLMTGFLILPSCAAINRNPQFTANQARQYIEDGEYKRALALLQSTCRQNGEKMLDKCMAAVEQVTLDAETSYGKKDFGKAGALYQILIQNGMAVENPDGPLFYNAGFAKKRMAECSRTLTEEGLRRYREDKLDEAISVWEKVLSFDPQNQPVKKAVATASKQLQRLKDIQ